MIYVDIGLTIFWTNFLSSWRDGSRVISSWNWHGGTWQNPRTSAAQGLENLAKSLATLAASWRSWVVQLPRERKVPVPVPCATTSLDQSCERHGASRLWIGQISDTRTWTQLGKWLLSLTTGVLLKVKKQGKNHQKSLPHEMVKPSISVEKLCR